MSICSSCPGLCCRAFNSISLTGADILRIKSALQLPYHFFTKVITIPKDQAEKMEKTFTLFSFNQEGIDIDDKFIFAIKAQDSTLIPEMKKCIFLQEWPTKGTGEVVSRCGIYDVRPYVCRAFPSYLDKNIYKGILTPPSESMKALDHCLSNYTLEDFSDPDKQIETLVLWDFEKKFFKKVSEKWNENPGKIDETYAFLEKEYSNRLIRNNTSL